MESAGVVFESNAVPIELITSHTSDVPVTGLDGFITFQITKKFSGNE